MSKWHFYDLQTGLFTGRVVLTDLGVVPPEGCGAIECPGGTPLNVRARCVNLQTGQVEAYQPAAPDADALRTWQWDAEAERWQPVPTLAAIKLARLAEMRSAALAADQADITLQGNTFAADDATRDELMREALIAQMAVADGQGFSLTWERVDGSTVVLSAAQLKAIVRAIRQRRDDIRAQLRERRAAIEAATTAAEVAAISWT